MIIKEDNQLKMPISQFDLFSIIPQAKDFEDIATKIKDYGERGKSSNYSSRPKNIALYTSSQGEQKLFRYFFVTLFLLKDQSCEYKAEIEELSKVLKNKIINDFYYRMPESDFKDDIRVMINFIGQNSMRINKEALESAKEILRNRTDSDKIEQSEYDISGDHILIHAKDGLPQYRIRVQHTNGISIHIAFRKKDSTTKKYNLVYASEIPTRWYNEPLFDSIQQAIDFSKKCQEGVIPTKRDIENFWYIIIEGKLPDYHTVDLHDCALVDTIAGPAYIQKYSKYYEESKKVTESMYNDKFDRDAVIGELEYFYGADKHFEKYSNAQLYRILEKTLDQFRNEDEFEVSTFPKNRGKCEICGAPLNDIGECPACDLGDEDYLRENIEKHNELNQKLWNKDNTLKEEVKEKLNLIIEEFLEGLKENDISIDLADTIICGSNCSYNYNKDSDLDLHLIAKHIEAPENLYDKIYSAYRSLFNKKLDIEFYGIPVEIFVENENIPGVYNGVYSIMQDKWLQEPVAEDIPEIDKEAFDKEFKVWEDRYNKIVDKVSSKLK